MVYTNGGGRPASAACRRYDLQGQKSKVKVARSCDQSQPSRPNAVPMSLVAGGGILCWPNPAVTLCIKFCDFFLIHARRPCPHGSKSGNATALLQTVL